MISFNKEQVLQEQQNGVNLIPDVEKIVDKICEDGYKNIFYVGIGGTLAYARQMDAIVKNFSAIPLYIENAADLTVVSNKNLTSKSIVVIESISGDTKEVVEAVNLVHKIGAKVIGYVEKEGSPLYEKSDFLISTVGGGLYYWYTVTLRFMRNAGDFPQYDKFINELEHMPEILLEVQKDIDPKAEAYAEAYKDEPIQYIIGSGYLEDWAYCYAMCILEEMQWMRTKSVSASDFFHGTLEVIDRDTCVMLIKGEDSTRPLMDRVERFVNTVSAKVTVFDSKEFELKGISEEFRGLVAPLIMRAAFQRISAHFEYKRRHPLAVRRYYRRLDY